jgi:hypothetical protein
MWNFDRVGNGLDTRFLPNPTALNRFHPIDEKGLLALPGIDSKQWRMAHNWSSWVFSIDAKGAAS